MFGLFKKKAVAPVKSTNEKVITSAANLLNIQLNLCRSGPDFQAKLHSNFVRGYFIGFFDSALQQLGVPLGGDDEFFGLIIIGHAGILALDANNTQQYASTSLRLQDNAEFSEGQAVGGKDFFDLITEKIRHPAGLIGIFHDIQQH